jgi:hypothetical protein
MIGRWLTAAAQYFRRPPTLLPHDLCRSIAEEVHFHMEEATREEVAAGMPAAAARRAARARFGDVGKVAADCYAAVSFDQLVCHRLHLGLTALLAGLLALFAVLWSLSPRAGEAPAGTGDISGQVVNERGDPIGGAHVLAVVKTWPPNGYRQQAYMTTSGPDGRFTVADVYPLGRQYEVQIATVADRRALESTYVSSEGEELEPVVFRLAPSEPLVLRIEGDDGASVAGAEVFPHRRIDAGGHDHLVYFQSADPIIRRTNEAGVVTLPCYLPGDKATVYVRLPKQEWHTRELVVPASGQPVRLTVNAESEGGSS